MKPLIGITCTKVFMNPPYQGAFVRDEYYTGIAKVGGLPLIIPLVEEEEIWQRIIERVDGLIFTGGSDIHPHFYGEGLHPQTGEIYPFRDRMELMAARYAMELDKPMLGICRGCQLLNVAKGGSLYQDINAQREGSYLHAQNAPRYEGTHYVNIVKDSRLYDVFGTERLFTNSFHHQAVKTLAPGLRQTAQADDGIIEGFESTEYSFLIGVQFHPEGMWHTYPEMLKLARYFVDYLGSREGNREK